LDTFFKINPIKNVVTKIIVSFINDFPQNWQDRLLEEFTYPYLLARTGIAQAIDLGLPLIFAWINGKGTVLTTSLCNFFVHRIVQLSINKNQNLFHI